MTPIDYRNATWQDLKAHLVELRLRVLGELRHQGPCTTRELAEKSGIDLLTLRPRITELHQLGFVELLDDPNAKAAASLRGYPREGVYQAVSEERAYQIYLERSRQANKDQQGTLAI